MFELFAENNLIPDNQSGFLNQMIHLLIRFFLSPMNFINLFTIIFKSTIFLDIYKVFDKVWHKGLIVKLKQNGI